MANVFDQFNSAEYGVNSSDQLDNKTNTSAVRRIVGDPAVGLAKSLLVVPEVVVGLANIASGGAISAAAQGFGAQLKKDRETLDKLYSPEQREANRKAAAAVGFVDNIKTAAENPSTVAQTLVDSARVIATDGFGARVLNFGLGSPLAGGPKTGHQ